MAVVAFQAPTYPCGSLIKFAKSPLPSASPHVRPQSLQSKLAHHYHIRTQSLSKHGRRLFCVTAMEVSGPGSINSSLISAMLAKLKEQLKTEDVTVQDAYGDGRHVSIEVVSSEFEGKSSVNRQRMVYKAIWEELQTTVHAVDSMRTLTPAEAAEERSKQAS